MKNAKANRNFTTKNLQTNVTRIWSVSLKTYIVSLAHFGWINHINEYKLIIDFEIKNIIKNKLNII